MCRLIVIILIDKKNFVGLMMMFKLILELCKVVIFVVKCYRSLLKWNICLECIK